MKYPIRIGYGGKGYDHEVEFAYVPEPLEMEREAEAYLHGLVLAGVIPMSASVLCTYRRDRREVEVTLVAPQITADELSDLFVEAEAEIPSWATSLRDSADKIRDIVDYAEESEHVTQKMLAAVVGFSRSVRRAKAR